MSRKTQKLSANTRPITEIKEFVRLLSKMECKARALRFEAQVLEDDIFLVHVTWSKK